MICRKHILSRTCQQLAKDARAVYHVKRIVLVNLDLIDEYLEAFRDEEF
jgi:hypothetical protein